MSSADWLKALHVSDRATARRWLREAGGEATLARIAHAYSSPSRSRGRPAKDDVYRPLVLRAAVLWMTNPNHDYGSAAAAIARDARLPATTKNVQRAIRQNLEIADAAFWILAETSAQQKGKVVLRNPADPPLPAPEEEAVFERRTRHLRRRHAADVGRLGRCCPAGWPTTRNIFAMLDAVDAMPISEAIRRLGDAANAWAEEQGAKNPI